MRCYSHAKFDINNRYICKFRNKFYVSYFFMQIKVVIIVIRAEPKAQGLDSTQISAALSAVCLALQLLLFDFGCITTQTSEPLTDRTFRFQ